jgi:cytochrome c-type biogenesis protein CcmF
MNGYEVTYVQDSSWANSREFTINYKRKDDKGNNIEEFDLHPHILYTRDFSKVASSNPSIKRYWNKDIFTNIASLPPQEISIENAKAIEDTIRFEKYPSKIGDTIFTKKYYAVVEDIFMNAEHKDYEAQAGDLSLGIDMRFHSLNTDASWLTTPVIALRKSLIYNFPYHEDDLGIRVKVDDSILDRYLTSEEDLDYKSNDFKIGESININQYQIELKGLDTDKVNSAYVAEEGDIKVAAVIQITNVKTNKVSTAYPLYVIRGKQQFQLKDFDPSTGFHFRFNNIDPKTEIANLEIAWQDIEDMKLPIEISENAPSGNYVVMKAIVFPGINLFWIGSILMMAAMFLGSIFKPRSL